VGKDFFHCSQCVPTLFPLSSQWVPIRFPTCFLSSHGVHQCVPNNTSLIPYGLANVVFQMGVTLYFKIEPSIMESLHSFI
jgi:hypothetical protein